MRLTVALLTLVGAVALTGDAALVKRAPVNNSGKLPGTNITLYSLTDAKTGKPVDFDTFVNSLLPGIPMVSDVVSESTLKKRDAWDESEYVRTFCIPQISGNPVANPYHEILTGRKNANYLRGAGRPMLFPSPGIDCHKLAPTPCTIAITKDITYTNAITYAVTDSQSNSITKTVGETNGVTNSSSIAETVSHTFEKNWSTTHTESTEESLSKTTGTIETTGWNKGTNNATIHNEDDTKSDTESEEHSKGESDRVSVSAGGSFIVNWSAEYGHDWTKNDSNGKSSTKSKTTQDGTNKAASYEDNYSKQTQDLTTSTQGSSTSDSSTEGSSESDTTSTMKTKSVEISVSKEWSKAGTTGSETGSTNTTARTDTVSSGMTWTHPVAPGDCMKVVCVPFAEMMILPYICADTEERVASRLFVSIAKVVQKDGIFSCGNYALVSCQDAVTDVMPFLTYDEEIRSITKQNSLPFGKVIDRSNPLVSADGDYTATIESNGNFVVWKNTINKIWESGATPFLGIGNDTMYRHRVRINPRGHLVVETANMFSKIKPAWQKDVYHQIWSTQPIANNYTVGTPRRPASTIDDYVLVLDNHGVLILYDAAYVVIWCSTGTDKRACPNGKGFRFQEEYLVPTDFPTPDTTLSAEKDPHNNILYKSVVRTDTDYIVSQDVNCTDVIKSGTGIQSANGRFKVILYPSGNLVIKDGKRNMWASYTANVKDFVAPYELVLTAMGNLVVRDARKKWLWATPVYDKVVGPFSATIGDDGNFVLADDSGNTIWESWPQRGKNSATLAWQYNMTSCNTQCGECSKTNGTSITVTNTINGTISTIMATPTTTTTSTTITSTLVPTPTTVPYQSILNRCKSLMDTYNVDPFVNWGTLTDTDLQAQWIYYDCACFGTYLKYGVEILRTNTGKWGKLTDAGIRKQYTTSYCNCPLAQDVYKINPGKTWGSLKDKTLQSQWDKEKCTANTQREPFVSNLDTGSYITTVVRPTPYTTVVTNYTTNFVDRLETTFEYSHETVTGTTTTVNNMITTTTYVTTSITNATANVIDYKTMIVTAGISSITGIPAMTATSTVAPTQVPTNGPTPTCTGGNPGKGEGDGLPGQCCKTQADCKEDCVGGKCTN